MSVQMIELEEVTMSEVSDEALELTAGKGIASISQTVTMCCYDYC